MYETRRLSETIYYAKLRGPKMELLIKGLKIVVDQGRFSYKMGAILRIIRMAEGQDFIFN